MNDPQTAERPLVTFALFAYNQEQYVREAIEGAFAQTYEPLEIILSDDCSTDQTFDVMQEMAARYNGPHRVIVRKNEVNLGTALHVSVVGTISSGELLVVAAGDDISVPQRTSKIVDVWISHCKSSGVLHSKLVQFRQGSSEQTEVPLRYNDHDVVDIRWFLTHKKIPYMAPTSAYSTDIFNILGPLPGGSIIEDGPLAIRSLLLGKAMAIDECLVKQRRLPETAGTGYSVHDPIRWNRFVASRIMTCVSVIKDTSLQNSSPEYHRELRRYFSKVAGRLGLFILDGNHDVGFFTKLVFFLKFALLYPMPAPIHVRVYRGATLVGWSEFAEWVKHKLSRGRTA